MMQPMSTSAKSVVLQRSIARLIVDVRPPKTNLSVDSRMKKPSDSVAGINESVLSEGITSGKTMAKMSFRGYQKFIIFPEK